MFPPILKSSQAAMIYGEAYKIYFTLPNTMTLDSNIGVHLAIMNQVNNKNLANNGNYITINEIYSEDNQYYVELREGDTQGMPAEQYYKIQLAFYNKKDNTDYSEWSTVMIIKIINKPIITILNDSVINSELRIESSFTYEQSATPLFTGQFQAAKNSNEYVEQYRFILKREGIEYLDSGWLQHNSSIDQNSNNISIDQWYPPEILQTGGKDLESEEIYPYTYTLEYQIKTQNGYIGNAKPYDFQIANTATGTITGIKFTFVDNNEYCLEEGVVQLYIQNDSAKTYGNYIITRKKENDPILEELFYFQITKGENDQKEYPGLIYTDYTIESGVQYQYYLQKINMYGLRSNTLPATHLTLGSNHSWARVDMQYSYLYADNVQLKLKYDNKMNSFKHTIQAAKQDTIGAKYATIVRNGHSYYAEFPINALISINLDENLNFFNLKNNQLYYRDELILSLDEAPQKRTYDRQNLDNIRYNKTPQIIDLTAENAYIERRFREKVEEFLNTTPYFLFKSPTEGNMIISLINVAFQPNDQLSRQIAAMTATAYETMECTINNMASVGLITIGSYNPVLDEGVKVVGQISGTIIGEKDWFEWDAQGKLNTSLTKPKNTIAQNIYDLIQQDIYERSVQESGGETVTEIQLYKIKTICFEPYPNIDLSNKLNELIINIKEIERKLKDIDLSTYQKDMLNQQKIQLEKEKTEYQQLIDRIKYDKPYPLIGLKIGKQPIQVGYNRILHLEDLDFQNITLDYTLPVLINYTAIAQVIESEKETPKAAIVSSTWDQLAGVFTDKFLISSVFKQAEIKKENDDSYYDNNSYYRDDHGQIIGISQSRGELYPTLNIRDLIEAKARKDTFSQYNIGDNEIKIEIPEDGSPYYYIENIGKIKYYFDSIKKISIEAQPGTQFEVILGNNPDTQIKKTIIMGPTWRYTVNPIDYNNLPIYDIKFKNGTYAIVDYICWVRQELYEESITSILNTIKKEEVINATV